MFLSNMAKLFYFILILFFRQGFITFMNGWLLQLWLLPGIMYSTETFVIKMVILIVLHQRAPGIFIIKQKITQFSLFSPKKEWKSFPIRVRFNYFFLMLLWCPVFNLSLPLDVEKCILNFLYDRTTPVSNTI